MAKPIQFRHPKWTRLFDNAGLYRLDDWKALIKESPRAIQVDDANRRYGGYSCVHQVWLDDPVGGATSFYVKQQHNQLRRSLRYPRGRPTYHNEFVALQCCLEHGVAVAVPVFFDSIKQADGDWHTLLVTLGLEGFVSLSDIKLPELTAARQQRLAYDVAAAVARLHSQGIAHRHLYGKHLLLLWDTQQQRFEVSFIDLEKSHPLTQESHRLRDLNTLKRSFSPSLWQAFMTHYQAAVQPPANRGWHLGQLVGF